MIKVINNVPNASIVKRTICRNCGVTLEYTPSDVKERWVSDYTGDKDLIKYIPCPSCNHQQNVSQH